ncbi:uncharacterized WD repeat-containing protein alr3466-like isoform X2 [Lineus longissimus]|uniref:uncharacterized WD repeat-containing protein alr3466-like isoform X2 n=1 Tax=Lineus longissimus TaxID=88925 RepID=UPI00315CC4F8
MAMVKHFVVRETHTRGITALGYNPIKREILIGFEDGAIKTQECDGGKLERLPHEHRGWITDFLFWSDTKIFLSAANDGIIVAWNSAGNTVLDRIHVKQPVYCMAINPRRQQLVCGVNGGIMVFDLDAERDCGHVVDLQKVYVAKEHTDIVRCLVCHESRVISGGYDQKLIIYDSSYTGDRSINPLYVNHQAHDAGISCLILAKDNENNTWVVTGSFDKCVKIWSMDGKLVHRLEGFLTTVTGVCFVPRNKTIWAVGGTSYAQLFDPKSGDNVSDFIGTFQIQEEEKYHLQVLKYLPEVNLVVGSTSRRHLLVWKYQSSGCGTALKCRSNIESLCYTTKVPLLIFSGDHDGVITKWERMQSNHFMYSKETLVYHDTKKKKKSVDQGDGANVSGQSEEQETHYSLASTKSPTSHYAFNKPSIPPYGRKEVSTHNHPNTTILKIKFVEDLDYILAASEDGNIYVWGFDETAVQVLKNMRPAGTEQLIQKYSILLDHDSELLPRNLKHGDEDSVTNRVAGFICKHVLNEHVNCVTCLEVIGREHGYDRTYVLSAGWDRRICIWDLEKGKLHDIFRNSSNSTHLEHRELASDGVIVDMAFNPDRKEFAYSSSDKMVYIRKFSLRGPDMVMINTLQGHEGEITCVRWNRVKGKWVTGSEDGTIRIWAGSGMNECEQILATQGQVCSMCIDLINGSIVAGVQEVIRVYDPEQFRLVQTNVGHTDAVRSIIHIPERNQYVSASWDQTIRIWNAWQMPRKKKLANEEKPKQMKRTSISSEVATDSQTKLESDANETEKVLGDGVDTVPEEPEGVALAEEE